MHAHTNHLFSDLQKQHGNLQVYENRQLWGLRMWLNALAYLTCPQPCFLTSTTENRQSSFDVKILKFPLPAAVLRRATLPLSWAAQSGWPWWLRCKRAGRLTNSVTTQSQTKGFELAHPSIYHIWELLEQVKGPVPQNQSFRSSMTQVKRISERSPLRIQY